MKRSRNDTGAELIELAIVLPLLLVCFAAIIDFGFLFQRYQAVTNAAREGARIAVLPNYTQADVVARIQSYLAASGLPNPPAPVVNMSATRTLPSGQTITVAEVIVTYPAGMQYLGPIAALVGGGARPALTLRATSVMRVEAGAGGS